MKITLTGLSADLFQVNEMETPSFSTVKEVKQELIRLKPELAQRAMMVAVNNRLAGDLGEINEGDQVLVFHPYAGG